MAILAACQVPCSSDLDCSLGERCESSGRCAETGLPPALAVTGDRPQVLLTLPFPGETAALPITPVAAFFARPVDPSTVNAVNFIVESEHGERRLGSVGVSTFPSAVTFVPNTPLAPGARYTATLPAETRDFISGVTLGAPYRWSFRIAEPGALHIASPGKRLGAHGSR